MKNEAFLVLAVSSRYQNKIIFGISCLKITDTNKCHAWPISKTLLVSAGLEQSTQLSPVQIQKNII
jgi:hypothetical protein